MVGRLVVVLAAGWRGYPRCSSAHPPLVGRGSFKLTQGWAFLGGCFALLDGSDTRRGVGQHGKIQDRHRKGMENGVMASNVHAWLSMAVRDRRPFWSTPTLARHWVVSCREEKEKERERERERESTRLQHSAAHHVRGTYRYSYTYIRDARPDSLFLSPSPSPSPSLSFSFSVIPSQDPSHTRRHRPRTNRRASPLPAIQAPAV
ncbi:hypothetical protein K504DRAFT_160585 [Pleomassaria siparia CBS 279.74]|uniref:Uncharacterized protein n=1 Tax=Pleomassaria siparia CBS 279.74 TaxID=1314801 RepID=A0A6G1JUE5_9PLEO|nr:hypothetical protein K504DRAFT_160585 [Pleomassaria siparia CBS 279.74]